MKPAKKTSIRQILCCMSAVFLFISLVILPCTSSAQTDTILLNNLIDEELSGTVVNCMLQDSNGFLWFGTQIGLYRYNGYSLEPYSFNSKLSNTFVSNFITAICEDNSKNIWLGTFGGGLFKLDPQTGEYTHFSNNTQNQDSLSDNTVRALFADDSGKLWIGTESNGLDCLDLATGHFTHYANTADTGSLSANTITSICRDKAGAFWIGTNGGGLNKFDAQTGKFLRYKNQADTAGSSDHITTLYLDRANILWIVTEDGKLNKFDPASREFMDSTFRELEGLWVNSVCEDISGTLWIGTYGNGVKMLDKNNQEFTAHGSALSQNTASSHYRVMSLYADTSGNLWIGTEGSGVGKINTNLNFISYKRNLDSGVSLSDDVVLSICKDKSGIIWVGTAKGGINRFDRENNQITYYTSNPADSNSISSNTVNSIYEDTYGTLWFGTIDGVLNKFDPPSETFVHYRFNTIESPNLKDNGILSIYEDSGGMIWACAANGGLIRLDRSTGQYTQFTNSTSDPNSISSNHVLSIAEDSERMLWVGTAGGGLNKLDVSSGKFTRYSINEPGSDVQTHNYSVNAIVDDKDILWLATDRGLYKFDKSSGASAIIEDNQEIANTFISGLIKDDRDNLWLSTANGLIKHNIQSGAFKKFDFDGGLQRNQYTPGAYFKSTDGEMFFGGTTGFSCFYADKIKDNTHTPPVVITDFKIFNTSARLADPGKVSLTYKDNFFSFEFAALDYADPVKNQYAYKLEGFDADWHYSGTRNYASYTNLDGGEYTLRIKASNNDGLWNEQGTQIKLIIAPPFWKTAWFIIAAFVFALAAIIILIKLRTRSIRLKSLALEQQVIERTKELNRANEELRHSDEMKSNFLSMVSHEIRTPLSAMLGFTELIAGKIEKVILPNIDLNDQKIQTTAERISRDLNIIITEGDRLSTLVNNLLNISKIESGKMDWKTEKLAIPEIIEQALSITKPVIEKAGLTARVDIEADLPAISGDRDMLTQVFINLISNAVKFTREGTIKVCAKNSDDNILISIEDTGVGIREDHLHRVFERFYKADPSFARNNRNDNIGLGLYICKQIIEKHGGSIWVESQLGKGSTFSFTILHL